ncbi:MAG: hypothetical protein HY756_08460 [Nitrospirae bacterium]|nr:hypothetical protein [Nitrospirota bacterium]
MKILYIVKQDFNKTAREIIDEHKKTHEVSIVDIRKEKDYNKIIDLIASSDKVISW